jgi:predicted GNAT family acetyltransferase
MSEDQHGSRGADLLVEVRNAPDRSRYEIVEEQAGTIGFVDYRLRPAQNRIILIHTEVDPVYAGKGFGVRLARYALDDARSSGLRIVPLCPFIAAYLTTHHEYDDILEPPARGAAPPPKADSL